MALVTSLGVHKPSAVPFLVAEGILPPEPSDDSYTWQTTAGTETDDCGDGEELLITEHCVVWSRGGINQRVFRFDVEAEAVTQAVFTTFPLKNLNRAAHTVLEAGLPRHGRADRLANAGLHVPKPRASAPSASVVEPNGFGNASIDKLWRSSSGARVPSQDEMRGRALVVLLKTQAHVFFLSGTSHVVHLPFEVDVAFPLTQGILLQRKLPHKAHAIIPSTPQLPSVPPNSFTMSASSPSEAMPNHQGQRHLTQLQTSQQLDQPFLPLQQRVLHSSIPAQETELPRFFCLTDPLSEMGVVITGENSNMGFTSKYQKRSMPLFDTLDLREELIYVSSKDELGPSNIASPLKSPLILAVTLNIESGTYTIWKLSNADPCSTLTPQGLLASAASGTASRRRSSYGPGAGTGTTTPISRGTFTGRENLGVARPHARVGIEGVVEDSLRNGPEDLVSQLDTAFENPAIPAMASRRVSSLLARADLSTSHDKSTFSEFAGGHSTFVGPRRGKSVSAQGARQSFGIDDGTSYTHPRLSSGLWSSLDKSASLEPSFEHTLDDLDDVGKSFSSSSGLRDSVQSLKKEMILTKVQSIPGGNVRHLNRSGDTKTGVFTLKPPYHSLRNDPNSDTIIMCLVDRAARTLLVLQLNVQCQNVKGDSDHSHYRKVVPPSQSIQRHIVSIDSSTRGNGIIDACSIRDGAYSRVLVLRETADGMGELSLQAPWSNLYKLQLPTSLCVHDPFKVTTGISLRQKREGGYRRVLSHKPQAFVALHHVGIKGRVDIVDSEASKHRIEVQLEPNNPHVRKMIRVCESVLPGSDLDQNSILSGWWDVVSWLRTLPDEELDIEWTAMVVVLFSMALYFIEDTRTETFLRHEKRKGGLLRSSSGANTNLESWEAMMSQERSHLGISRTWLQDGAWQWTVKQDNVDSLSHPALSEKSRPPKSSAPYGIATVPMPPKSTYLKSCTSLARDFLKTPLGLAANGEHGYLPTASSRDPDFRCTALATVLVGLHLLREEFKLDILDAAVLHNLTPVLAQLGCWLGWDQWGISDSSYFMLESSDMEAWQFEDSVMSGLNQPAAPFEPPSILRFIESVNLEANVIPFPLLSDVVGSSKIGLASQTIAEASARVLMDLTPKTITIISLLSSSALVSLDTRVSDMASWGMKTSTLETLPESVAVSFRAAISKCQGQPLTSWNQAVLNMIGRDDIGMLERDKRTVKPYGEAPTTSSNEATRDVHTLCSSTFKVETVGAYDGVAELDRQSISRMIFKEDQRFAEAAKLVHPLHAPTARCVPEPDWSDTDLLEAQQELVKTVAMRTLSVSLGRSLIFYSARLPLLTEKFPIHGFTLSCVMKPTNTTVTADRNTYTEEKVSWAFFHAGVEAGLSISRDAKGIDTSWILFNKPHELKNRHAGFLLALGLNGHLKSIAKWVAFKYLTPKHTMTSIGLLLGLSASYLGTMDTLITRLLSVHVTRMLPPGAAELNISPLTQTSGVMGIGLLYCNTQHRRMSEIMLSEMENVDQEDNSSPFDSLRDEGYRLAAGFALGYINLGRGKDLKGLHDMHIVERLLALAIGTKRVNIVHILDKATAAATIAIALIFMKTHDEALSRKIDIPDTTHQFDYVRPDIFLLRTVARHLIMWNDIRATHAWMRKQLPSAYQYKLPLSTIRALRSEDTPFFNIVAGLCFSVGLRHAGTGSHEVRNLLSHYLDQFMRICRLPAPNYDGRLARITVRNCQDVVALSAACVMAGTGDLHIFRRLRSLHGRTDADTPFGSHLAAHFAIGVLFLGGGTYTFGTSNIAIASLLCAFYPLFPNTVLDNKSHLQAFRHFWVLASEPRCLVTRDADSLRPVSIPVLVTLRTGAALIMTAPCLLPELDTVAKIQTNDPEYWRVTLDLAENPTHLQAFNRHQSIYLRRRAAYDAHASIFSATLQALNDAQSAHQLGKQAYDWLFKLPSLNGFGRAEQALILPPDVGNALYSGTRSTVVDDRLMLEMGCIGSETSDKLWNLRVLFSWADGISRHGGKWAWFSKEIVDGLRTKVAARNIHGVERNSVDIR